MSVATVLYTESHQPLLRRILDGAFAGPLHDACETATSVAELEAALRHAEVLVMMDSQLNDDTLPVVLGSPSLRWVQLASSGFERALAGGLPEALHVTHAPSVWGPTVAEHAVTLLLALVRRIPRSVELQRQHDWSRAAGSEGLGTLVGSSALVVGAGAIGGETARRLKGLDMHVVGVSSSGRARVHEASFDELESVGDLQRLLPSADAVVVCIPLTPATTGFIGRDEFAAMRDGCYLVNVSRGAVVDQTAMLDALGRGRLGGVGLDVVDPEPLPADSDLWDRPDVLISPHVGGYSGQAGSLRLREFVLDNLDRYERGAPLRHPVGR